MWKLLVTVRDFLVALALAWVGVSLEARPGSIDDTACAGAQADQCATERGD